MGLTEFYHGIEDKYYAGLDWLDKHGIPVYSVVDAIEAQNIPSFPIAALVTLLIIGGLWVFLSPALLGGNATLNVLVQDDTQTPLKGIAVQLTGEKLSGDALSKRLTDEKGRVTFTNLPIGESITIQANNDAYAISDLRVVLDQGNNDKKLTATEIAVTKSISLQLYKVNSTETFSESIPLSFSCSGDAYTKTSTVAGGQITLDVPPACGTLSVVSLDSTLTLQGSVIDVDDANPRVYVNAQPSGSGVLRATLLNESGNGIAGLTTMLKSKFGDVIATKFSDASGFVEFTNLAADTYTIFVQSDGMHAELDSGSIEVNDNQTADKTFTIPLASVGEVRLQFIDEGNLSPVGNAKVTLSRGNQLISTKTTNEGGQVTFSVSSPNSLTVGVDHPSYLVRAGISVSVSSAGYTSIPLAKATLQNSQIVTVKVLDELNQPVENAYVALKKSPSGASIGTNKITGASGTVQFTSLEEGTYFASAYKPGFSDQIKSDLFTVRARENVESTIKLVIGTGTIGFSVKDTSGQPLAGATIQAVDGITHNEVGNELATNVDGTTELTLRADRYVYFVIDEPNHLPYVTLPIQVKKGITQNVSVEMVKDISKLEIKTLSTSVNGKPILEESGLAPGQTYTIRFALMVPRNTAYTETGVHVRTGNANEGQTNPIENDAWYIRDVRGAFSKIQKGTTYTPPTGLGIDSQHVTSADAKWANLTFNPSHEGLTIVEVDVTVKDTAIQGADLPLYYRAWGKTGSYVRFPVDAVLGGSESVSQKQGLYANANVKLYSTGAGTHVCTNDFCLGLVGEDLTNGLQMSLVDDFEVDISSKQKLLFTFTSVSDAVFADTSLILQSSTGSATLTNYDVTNAVGAKKTGVVSGNKVEIPIGTIQKNNVVFGFVNLDASKEGTSRVKFSLVSNKKEVYARELLVKVNAAGVLNVEIVPKAILPLLTNQLLVHVTQTVGGDDIPLENASVNIALNGTLLTSGFTDSEGVFPFELNEPNVNDSVEITASKQGYKPVTQTIAVGEDIVSFIPATINESLIVNGTTRKTRDVHMLNLASIPLTIKDITLSGDFDGLVKFDLLNEEIIGETLGVNQDRNVTIAFSLTEKGQNLLAAKTLKGSVLVKLSSATSEKTFTNALSATIKIGFGGEVDVEDCLLVEPAQWDVYADPKETKQQAFEIKNTCTVKSVPVKLTNLSAKVKQLAGDPLGTFTAVTSDKTTQLGSGFKTILTTIPAGGEIIVTTSFSPDQILSGTAMPQLIFQATNMTDNGVPDLVEESVKVNLVVNALSKCVQVKTPSVLEIDSCAINTGMGNLGSYYNQVYRPTGVPYFNPSFSTLNNTTNPSGSSLLPSNQSGGFGSFNFGMGQFSPQFGASGYDGYGNFQPGGMQFSPQNGYGNMQGMYANPFVDRFNYGAGMGMGFGCGGSEIRIENSCQSEIEIQLDADPNVHVSKSAAVLKPNQTERIRVGAGYRIGKYPVFINARSNGSKDASLEVATIDVLIKSPTEVNADCITLNNTKYRFNELLQKPVKGKVINKCYNSGVRLVPSADTITIASYFNVDDQITLTEKGSVKSRKNTMAHDIQLIGVQTRGQGRDTIQELEFQLFPDFETYKRVLSPFTEQAGVGKQLLDLKLFIEGQYYRAESYGTISVKYLDAYGGAQQKPFPVIFENLWRLAPIIDMGDGNPDITNFQQCINNDVLQYETSAKGTYVFDDDDFRNDLGVVGTTHTFVTTAPREVLIANDQFCGGKDFLSDIDNARLISSQNPSVTADFRIVGKRNIQVTINRPLTLNQDAIIKGRLKMKLTRTAFNINTQDVYVDVSFTVSKPGKVTNIAKFKPIACVDPTSGGSISGYEKGEGFNKKYGFDLLKWDWSYSNSPSCDATFCDATQLSIWLNKKIKTFNEFLSQNTMVFSPVSSKVYSTKTMVLDMVKKVGPIKDDSTNKSYTFIAAGNGLLNVKAGSFESLKEGVTENFNEMEALSANNVSASEYVAKMNEKLSAIDALLSSTSSGATAPAEVVITLNGNKLANETDKLAFQLLGAETTPNALALGSGYTKKYYWTFHEFKKFHDSLQSYLFNPTGYGIPAIDESKWGSSTIANDQLKKIVMCPTTQYLSMADTACASTTTIPPANERKLFISPTLLKTIYSAIESVDVVLILPTESTLTPELSDYMLKNAAIKNVKFAPYLSMSELSKEFLFFNGLLLPDTMNSDLITDIGMVALPNYEYAQNFDNSKTVTSNEYTIMKDMNYKSVYSDRATKTERKITSAGRYPLAFEATWESGAKGIKELTFTIQESGRIILDGTPRATLEDVQQEKQPDGIVFAYPSNPFFGIPFNGSTGLDGRTGYGASYGMRVSGELVKVTPSTPTKSVVVKSYSTIDALSDFIQTEKQPTLLNVKSGTSSYEFDFAPSIPVGLRADVSNPSGNAVLQYGIVKKTFTDSFLDASPILWHDCTQNASKLVKLQGAQCSKTQSNQFSLVGDVRGNDYFYSGLALVPDITFALVPVCAAQDARVNSSNLTSPIDITGVVPGLGEDVPLNNAAFSNITNIDTIQEMINLVTRGDACGKMDGSLSIIWDASSPRVVPKALQCGSPINANE